MLSFCFQLPSPELDQLIASYGVAEDRSQNNEYLNDIIQLASDIAESEVCYISMLDSKNQIIISSRGMDTFPLSVKKSICQTTVADKKTTIIEDISCDPRTRDLEVSEGPYKYYAGFPLINSEGVAIGSLCMMDDKQDLLDAKQVRILELIAKRLVKKLDSRRQLIKLIKEINQNFKPAACSEVSCLQGELAHLQTEVIVASNNLKSQQKELSILNKNLSQLAHRIAHDLKAPLRSINSFIQLIKRQIDSQPVTYNQEHFQYVNSSVLELHRMVDNVLDIAEMKTNVSREKVSISELIDIVELMLSSSLKSGGVQLIKPINDVRVIGYKSLLLQVFSNIISNAVKYQDPNKKPEIRISLDLLETVVLVNISDNGIGISKENLEEIFKPFKRVTNDTEVSGLGIGLDTCSIIINDMGSELKVDSKLDVGTTFSFEIPLV